MQSRMQVFELMVDSTESMLPVPGTEVSKSQFTQKAKPQKYKYS